MGKPFSFRKQGGGTDESFRAQSNVETAFQSLGNSIITNGNFLENISLPATGLQLEHKLGRAYRGFIICKSDGPAKIYAGPDTDKTKFINLQSDIGAVVSVWVF